MPIVIFRYKFFTLLLVTVSFEAVLIWGWLYAFRGWGRTNPVRAGSVLVAVPFGVLFFGACLLFLLRYRGHVVVGGGSYLVFYAFKIVDGKIRLSTRFTEGLESITLLDSSIEIDLPNYNQTRKERTLRFMRGDEELFIAVVNAFTVPGYRERFQQWQELLTTDE